LEIYNTYKKQNKESKIPNLDIECTFSPNTNGSRKVVTTPRSDTKSETKSETKSVANSDSKSLSSRSSHRSNQLYQDFVTKEEKRMRSLLEGFYYY
jgi:hypothetical protein